MSTEEIREILFGVTPGKVEGEITPSTLSNYIEKYSKQYGVDSSLTKALVTQESGGDTDAVSHAGAMGTMQIMPETAAEVAAELNIPFSPEMLYDPETNIKLGTYYLSKQLKEFGDEERALAAYHAGPGAVRNANIKGMHLPNTHDGLIATPDYVDSILKKRGKGEGISKAALVSAFEGDEIMSTLLGLPTHEPERVEIAMPDLPEGAEKPVKMPEPEIPPHPLFPEYKPGEEIKTAGPPIEGKESLFLGPIKESFKQQFRSWGLLAESVSKADQPAMKEAIKQTEAESKAYRDKGMIAEADLLDSRIWNQKAIHKVYQGIEKAGANIAESFQPSPEYKQAKGIKGMVQNVMMGLAQLPITIAASFIGTPIAGGLWMGGQIAGGKIEKLEAEGVEPERALVASIADASMQAPLESLGIGKIMKLWQPGKVASKVLKQIADAGATEFITEGLQAFPDAVTEIWAKSEGKTNNERVDMFISDFWNILKQAGYEASVGGIVGMLGGSAGALATGQVKLPEAPPAVEITEEGVPVHPGGEKRIEARIEAEKVKERAKEKPTEKVPVVEREVTPIEKEGIVKGAKVERYKPTEKELETLPEPEKIDYIKGKGEKKSELARKTETLKDKTLKEISEADREGVGKTRKSLAKSSQDYTANYEGEIERLESAKKDVEFASKLQQDLKSQVLKSAETKAEGRRQWNLLIDHPTGKKAESRSPEVNKIITDIAKGYNAQKTYTEDEIRRGVAPPEYNRIIGETDNQKGLNVNELKKYHNEWEAQNKLLADEYEKTFEEFYETGKAIDQRETEIGKEPIEAERFREVGEKIEEPVKKDVYTGEETEFPFGANVKDEPEMFDIPTREGILESKKGAIDFSSFVKSKKSKKRANFFAKFIKKNFTTKGDLPEEAFEAKITNNALLRSELKALEFNVRDFKRLAPKAYKTNKLSSKQKFEIDQVFKGEKAIEDLPKQLQSVIKNMRAHTDAMSQKLIDMGIVEGDLALKVKENMGHYATRAYRSHTEPKWAKKVPKKIRNRAKAFLRQELEGSKMMLFDEPAKQEQLINGMIDELLYKHNTPLGILSGKSKLGAKNLSILKKRKNIPAEIRALWGEYKDADVNYANSVSKMAHIVTNHKFLSEVAEKGKNKFFFDEPIVKDDISYSMKISKEGNPSMTPLDGMYTTKEIKNAFEDALKNADYGPLFRHYMKINAATKYSKTILSPMTHIRNTTGNSVFALANGHFNLKPVGKAISTTFADFVGAKPKEQRARIREYTELGLIGEGARAGEIRDVIKDATQGDLDVLVGEGPKKFVKRALKFTEKAYGAEDDVWKIFAYENEYARYKKAYPDKTDAEIKKKAASIVRDTYPTYSMISRGVKAWRRMPVLGTFVSFPAEVIRTGKNTINLIGKELSDPATRKIGAQRLVGTFMAATALGAVTAGARYLTGINREKEEAYREFMPPWSENSQIIFTGEDKQGRQTYIDLGYTDPHSYLKTVRIGKVNYMNPLLKCSNLL
jgi:hypothetical protein